MIQPPRAHDSSASASPQEPLLPVRRPSEGRLERLREVAGAVRPVYPWVAGAAGSGLMQAALAVSSRPDAHVAEIATAGTAMAIGTWLYGEGVGETLRDALTGRDVVAVLETVVALGSCAAVAAGVTLAARGEGPVKMMGVGLTTLASAGFHHTLALSFARRRDSAEGMPQAAYRAGRGAIFVMAGASVVGAVVATCFRQHLSAAYAAGALLFCQAVLGTAWSTYRQMGS